MIEFVFMRSFLKVLTSLFYYKINGYNIAFRIQTDVTRTNRGIP